MRRYLIPLLLAGALAPAGPAACEEAPFPSQPITIMVPTGVGGGSYRISERVAQRLRRSGIAVEVRLIAKSGGSGLDAIEHFMAQPPNGYVVLQHWDQIMNHFAAGRSRWSPTEELALVATAQVTYAQLYISNVSSERHEEARQAFRRNVSSWEEFLAYASRRDESGEPRVKIAQGDNGWGVEGIMRQVFSTRCGLEIEVVSLNQPSRRYQALGDGVADALIEQPGDVDRLLERNAIKPILTMLPKAHPDFPAVPAFDHESFDNLPCRVDEPPPVTLHRTRSFFVHAAVPSVRFIRLRALFQQAIDELGEFARDGSEPCGDNLLSPSCADYFDDLCNPARDGDPECLIEKATRTFCKYESMRPSRVAAGTTDDTVECERLFPEAGAGR